MTLLFEIAFTACGLLEGTTATKPGPKRRVAPSIVQFTFDDVIDLFLRVEMLVDRGARVELVMRERHAWRIEIAASPARQAFDSRQFAGVDERLAEYHVHSEPASALILRTPVTHCHICGRLGYA